MAHYRERQRDGSKKLAIAVFLAAFSVVCAYVVYAGHIYRATSGSDVGFLVTIGTTCLSFAGMAAAVGFVFAGVRMRRPTLESMNAEAYRATQEKKRVKGQKAA